MSEKNNVIESGVIVNKYTTPKVTLLTLAVRSGKMVNYPRFVFLGDFGKEVAEKYNERDHVTITGNVQSSKRTIDGKTVYSQSLFAEKIEVTPKMMETSFGQGGSRYEQNKNIVELSGEVASIQSPSQNMIQTIVRTVKNGHLSFVRAVYFGNDCGQILENIHRGDKVCILAEIQTPRKEKDGVTNYYENVIVQEIVKAE